jgi:nitroreductase
VSRGAARPATDPGLDAYVDPDALAALWERRRSARAFGPEPLDREVLASLFAAAQRAPSWCNIQPWRVIVTAPPVTAALGAAVLAAYEAGEPYLGHRRACARSLYEAMGITRGDDAGRGEAWRRNYTFFGAPHLAVVSIDRRLGAYAMLDVGVWLGYVLTQAEAMGIAACPMASVAAYPGPLRRMLPIGDDQHVIAGIALGRADVDAPANRCHTPRAPLDANVTFVGSDS